MVRCRTNLFSVICLMVTMLITAGYAENDSKVRTLVVILSETRAHELTYDNCKENLIDVLNADLAVCVGVGDHYDYSNPFYQNAKYRFVYKEPDDYAVAFDYAYSTMVEKGYRGKRPFYWGHFLKIRNQFLGGIKHPQYQHPGSAGILIFYRWFLLQNLLENDLLDKYDFFVITRSDYLYTLPHPKTELLSPDEIYVPDGEHYGGITDRHVVLPSKFVTPYLNILNNMVWRGAEYYKKMSTYDQWNLERFIAFHLKENNVWQYVKFFPYVMYAVRPKDGTTRWALGNWSEEHQYFIKYDSEYNKAHKNRTAFEKEGCTIDEFYKARIGQSVHTN